MTKLSVPAHHGNLPIKLRHAFHPRHSMRLSPDDDGVRFRCDGCKLPGAGARYECGRGASCDVDLHVGCALAPPASMIGGFKFALLHEPPAPADGRVCDACGEDALGFVYHCFDIGHDLHPGCAESFQLAGLSFELCSKEDRRARCVLCKENIRRRRRGRDAWYYRCDVDVAGEALSSLLHVACAKVLANEGFANVPLDKACDRAVAYASESIAGGFIKPSGAFPVYRGGDEIVPVNAPALKALLLHQRNKSRRGGALGRSLRALGFIVRVVIGIIFGDPTAMLAAVAGVVLSGR